MILYHFTSRDRAEWILLTGYIDVSPWGIGTWDLAGFPDVAWFQASRRRYADKGYRPGPADWSIPANTEIRFTVNVRDAQPWRSWAASHGLDRVRCRLVANGRHPRWYVTERPVAAAEWISVAYACNGRDFRFEGLDRIGAQA